MLRYWMHPLAADQEFRNDLLEGAAGVLRSCVSGQQVMAELLPGQMNFIAASWYVEWTAVESGSEDVQGERRAWLEKVRKGLPSCFCAPDRLP